MCNMQSPKDCASLLFNFLCLETQREKNKARFGIKYTYTNKVYFILNILIIIKSMGSY